MTTPLEGKISRIFYDPVVKVVTFMLQDDPTRYTMQVIPGHRRRRVDATEIGLTQPGDDVIILASAPDLAESTLLDWNNVTIAASLAASDDNGGPT